MSLLLFKVALVPTLIAAITLAGRRWGAGVAGWLSAFPIVSAPVLCFIALEDGIPFATTAALGTLIAVLAILAFGLSYAWGATRFGWQVTALLAFSAYAVTVLLLDHWTPTLMVAVAVILAVLIVIPRAYPHPAPSSGRAGLPVNDLWVRMVTGGTVVFGVTHFSATMGPHLSGLAAMFPATGSILAIFSHRTQGPGFAITLVRGMVPGYYSFVVFCSVLILTLPHWGVAAFAPAVGGALAVQLASRRFV